MAIASLPYYAGALFSRNLPNAMRFAPTAGLAMTSAQVPSPMQPAQPTPSSGEHLQMLKDFERTVAMANQQRFRPMPTEVPMPTNPAEVPLYATPTGAPMPTNPAEVPMARQMGQEQRFRPMPAASRGGTAPMQGPPMPSEFNVPGFAKGYANAAPGMSAQQYADQFAGGDLGKVKARQILVDGQLVNDFYTKGLLEGLLGGPAAMKPIEGTPANVPLLPQRPAEFGPSYQGGGLLSSIPFIGGLFGG
jgi:hypothetical protein